MDETKGVKPFSGSIPISIRFDLYDGVEKTLAFHGIGVNELVMRAFVESANAANGFNVAHHTIEIKVNGRSLWFNTSTYPVLESNEICLCVTPGQDPHRIEQVSEALKELFDEFNEEPFNATKH